MAAAAAAAAKTEEVINAEIMDSVAFSLVDNVYRTMFVSEAEATFFKAKYRKLYETVAAVNAQEHALAKKLQSTTNEVLAEKIQLERTRIDEGEQTQQLRRLEEARNSLQKELEFTEQRDTMAKFELAELRKVHEELTDALSNMRKENTDMVTPVLTKLRQQLVDLADQLHQADESHERETSKKHVLVTRLEELEVLKDDKDSDMGSKAMTLNSAANEPHRLSRQVESSEKAANAMEAENKSLKRKIKDFEKDMELQAKKRSDTELLKKSLLEKLELNRQTIEKREQDVAAVQSNLEVAKAKNHDLITSKVELNVVKRDTESTARHRADQLSFAKKEYDNLKRQLKKKQIIANSVRQMLPTLAEQLKDQESMLGTLQTEREFKAKELQKLKNEVDTFIAQFLQQEGLEQEKKKVLEEAISRVDDQEAQVVHWLAESKRQAKLKSVLSGQRDIKARDCARVEQKEKDARQHVKIKELVIMDLTKRCNELANRLKEFSALYEVVKNERNKYVSLIQGSTQVMAEMREKIRILHNEIEILTNESTAKDIALAKEKSAHQQAQNIRDSLRQDLNRLLSEYKSKQNTVEQQIMEIDKLNIVINTLEKDMIELKVKYERAVEDRNVTGVQLIDRNDELCILYERSNQQQEALRNGEVELLKKDEELRLLRLQTEELRRQYLVAKRRLPEKEINKARIAELEQKLAAEMKRCDDLSANLEDPSNQDRWRPLDGDDPDQEQLSAKVKVLEDRMDKKREQLLEKELVLEEVATLTERLRSQALAKRDSAKALADQLNDLQHKIQDTTKRMLASVSELSMYQVRSFVDLLCARWTDPFSRSTLPLLSSSLALSPQATALRLQQEKMTREKVLEEAKWRFDHGEAPTEDASKDWNRQERKRLMNIETAMRREEELQMALPLNATKTAAEPRPTAYIPDDIGIPKPYGNSAPFKPIEGGVHLKRIPKPIQRDIEI